MTQVRIGIANDNEEFVRRIIVRLRYNGWDTVTMPDERRCCGYRNCMLFGYHGSSMVFFTDSQREVLSLVESGGYGGPGFDAGFVRAEGVLSLRGTHEVRRDLRMRCLASSAEIVLVTNTHQDEFGYQERMALLQVLVDAIEAWPMK